MTMPLKANNPGESEFSHGKGRTPHPDSDFQTGVKLPWETAERNQGAKRGGFTQAMRQQAERNLDSTRVDEKLEDMLYVKGNPDTGSIGGPLVEVKAKKRPNTFKQPVIRDGVIRQ